VKRGPEGPLRGFLIRAARSKELRVRTYWVDCGAAHSFFLLRSSLVQYPDDLGQLFRALARVLSFAMTKKLNVREVR